jgi:hypothetical protein
MWPTPALLCVTPDGPFLQPPQQASKQVLSCRCCINLGSRLLPPSVLGPLLLDGLGSSEKGRLHAVQPELNLAMFDSCPGRPPVLFPWSLTDSRSPFPQVSQCIDCAAPRQREREPSLLLLLGSVCRQFRVSTKDILRWVALS